MIIFAGCAYGLVALLFLIETYVEGENADAHWDLWRVVGLFFCLLWPAYAVAVFAVAAWSGRTAFRTTTDAK